LKGIAEIQRVQREALSKAGVDLDSLIERRKDLE
jgi:hypothetical protein